MRYLYLDTETDTQNTELGRYYTKPVVCVQFAEDDGPVQLLHAKFDRAKIRDILRAAAHDPECVFVAHMATFDLGVLVASGLMTENDAFLMGWEKRIWCTLLAEKMIENARGPSDFMNAPGYFGLNSIGGRYRGGGGGRLKKGADSFRLRYAELMDIPVSVWPAEAKTYAMEDVVELRFVAQHQAKEIPEQVILAEGRVIPGFALMEKIGISIDKQVFGDFSRWVQDSANILQQTQEALGIVAKDPKTGATKMTPGGAVSIEKKKLQALVEAAYAFKGEEAPRTPVTAKGGGNSVRTGMEFLIATDNPGLLALAEGSGFVKLLTSYVTPLMHLDRVTGMYDLMKKTGRTGMSKHPLQQSPKAAGYRECFVARPGFALCSIDYSAIELVGFAHVLLTVFGKRRLADTINAGQCPHLAFSAALMGISFEEALARYRAGDPEVKKTRNSRAKAANFGLAGGMTEPRFIEDQKKKGEIYTFEEARELRRAWIEWTESEGYFQKARYEASRRNGSYTFVSGAQRTGLIYTAYCNIQFQALIASFAKEALFRCAEECLLAEPGELLYGCVPLVFVHDEIIFEIPLGPNMSAAGEYLAEIMVTCAREVITDITVRAEPAFMHRWMKSADSIKDENGQYVIFDAVPEFKLDLKAFLEDDEE